MQAQQLKSLVDAYSKTLHAASATEASARLTRLAHIIGIGGSQSAAKFFDKIKILGLHSTRDDERDLTDLVPILEQLPMLLTEAGGKKTVLADIDLLLDLVRRNSKFSLSDIESVAQTSVASASRGKPKPKEQPVDTMQLVDAYLKKLESALGNDPQFRSVFRELSEDRRISKSEAIAIASKFYQPTAPSTSRPKALQTVLRRHEKLMESRAASATIGGKAA